MPTLLELLGISIPEGLDGRSWVALLNKETQPNRDFVITHVNTVSSGKSLAQRCIRTSDRALMFHAWVGGPESFRVEAMSGLSFAAMKASENAKIQSRVKQLVTGERLMFFNTLSDPTERKNLLEDAQYRSEIERLGQKLLDYMRQTDDPLADQFSIELAAFISKAR
jgi:N-sulfoglucosamine sulfohydrolase